MVKKNMYRRLFVLLTALSSALSFGMNTNLGTSNRLGFGGGFLPSVNQGWEEENVECFGNGDANSAHSIGLLVKGLSDAPTYPWGASAEDEEAPVLEDEIVTARVNAGKQGTKRDRGEPAEAEANVKPQQKRHKRKATKHVYKCKRCGKPFDRSADLTVHMKTHAKLGRYHCKECFLDFNKLNDLTRHMLTHTGERPYKCTECPWAFTRLAHLRQHMLTHTGERPFECKEDGCSKTFTQSSILKRHMKTHKTYKCEECPEVFARLIHLTGHMPIHTGEKPFGCEVCSERFADKRDLTGHLSTHISSTGTSKKPFACDYPRCGKTFPRKSGLTQHKRRYQGHQGSLFQDPGAAQTIEDWLEEEVGSTSS